MDKKEHRLSELLLDLKLNPKEFAESIGLKRADRIYFVLNGRNDISIDLARAINKKYPNVNVNWLLTGKGEMLIGYNPEKENILSKPEQIPTDATYKLVPVIHIDSVGGIHSNNNIEGEPQYIEGYIPFVNAKDGDKAIYQSGDSMIPTVPPGSLMQIREVTNWREYFGYGNIFVIELSDGRRITKEVARYDGNAKEYVWCVSHNPSVADEELPKNMIVSVWKVIKVLTDKGW